MHPGLNRRRPVLSPGGASSVPEYSPVPSGPCRTWRTLGKPHPAEAFLAGAEEEGGAGCGPVAGRGDGGVGVVDPLVVERETALRGQAARLAAGGAKAGADEEVGDDHAGGFGGRDFGRREGGIVGDGRARPAEESASGSLRFRGGGFAVGQGGGFDGEDLFRFTQGNTGDRRQVGYPPLGHVGEKAEETSDVVVFDVDPILVVVVWAEQVW